jgi:hypothetical protein
MIILNDLKPKCKIKTYWCLILSDAISKVGDYIQLEMNSPLIINGGELTAKENIEKKEEGREKRSLPRPSEKTKKEKGGWFALTQKKERS